MMDEETEFRFRGEVFTMTLITDDDIHQPPWEESDCHGAVSPWQSGPDRDTDVELCRDGSLARYYDKQGAWERAMKEDWCASAEDRKACDDGTLPDNFRVARAVEADIKYLKGWCDGDWWYVGVVVADQDGNDQSIWGYSSDDTKGHLEAAHDLASEMVYHRESESEEPLITSERWPGWPYVHVVDDPVGGRNAYLNALNACDVDLADDLAMKNGWRSVLRYAMPMGDAKNWWSKPAFIHSGFDMAKLNDDLDYALKRVGYLKWEMSLFTRASRS